MGLKLFIVGGVLVLAGLGVGLWPVKVGQVPCGSVFGGASSDQSFLQEFTRVEADCDHRRTLMGVVSFVLLGAGAVSAGAGVVVSGARRSSRSVS